MRIPSGGLIVLLLLTDARGAFGQATKEVRGVVLGVVTDETHYPLAGAKVSIPALGRKANVTREGRFLFRALRPGSYTLVAWRKAFRPETTEVTVAGGDSVSRTIELPWATPFPVPREKDLTPAVPYVGPFPAAARVTPADSAAGRLGRAVGVVTTCDGKPLVGPMVAIDPSRYLVVPTSRLGGFALPPQAPGNYKLLVRMLGYQSETLSWKARKGRVDTLQSALVEYSYDLCECFVTYQGRMLPYHGDCYCGKPRCRQPKAR